MSDLFRQEAIDHRRARFHGSILLSRPRSQSAWTLALCTLLGVVFVLAGILGFERQETISGILVPQAGAQRLRAPPSGGTVTQVLATRGQTVSAETPLFTLIESAGTAGGPRSQSATISAERDGRLIDLLVQPGDAVAAGQLLGIIAPRDGGLEVELYAPSRTIGLIRTGTALSIHYNAFPHAVFGQSTVRVRDVSATAIPAAEFGPAVNTTQGVSSVYRVRATLPSQTVTDSNGKSYPLAPGMDVTALLLAERHTVLEWIVEPLVAKPGDTR